MTISVVWWRCSYEIWLFGYYECEFVGLASSLIVVSFDFWFYHGYVRVD